FVANGSGGNSVTEFNASTRMLVRVIKGAAYRFDQPQALAVSGNYLFVTNLAGSLWTEVNVSTGAFVRVISASADGLRNTPVLVAYGYDVLAPADNGIAELDAATGKVVRLIKESEPYFPLVVHGKDLVVVEPARPQYSLAELNLSTGDVIRVISGAKYKFTGLCGIAVAGSDLFVGDQGNPGKDDSVTEVNLSTGVLVRVISGAEYRFQDPDAVAESGGDVFVANGYEANTVTEIDASTGALVTVLSSSRYQFDFPYAFAVSGGDLFVVNSYANSVTELPD
ncbi:MAG: hypothetical protein ACLQK4_05310, partial [Acidimicrobiales bacterium]